jgi:hypothetical protein
VFVYTCDGKDICLANLGKYDELWNNKGIALDKLGRKEKKHSSDAISGSFLTYCI